MGKLEMNETYRYMLQQYGELEDTIARLAEQARTLKGYLKSNNPHFYQGFWMEVYKTDDTFYCQKPNPENPRPGSNLTKIGKLPEVAEWFGITEDEALILLEVCKL